MIKKKELCLSFDVCLKSYILPDKCSFCLQYTAEFHCSNRLYWIQWKPFLPQLIALHQPLPAQPVCSGHSGSRGDYSGLRQVGHSLKREDIRLSVYIKIFFRLDGTHSSDLQFCLSQKFGVGDGGGEGETNIWIETPQIHGNKVPNQQVIIDFIDKLKYFTSLSHIGIFVSYMSLKKVI